MRMLAKYPNRRAFSLVETMVAAVLLSGSVMAICSISTKSFRGVKLNRDYELAWDLLDRQLTIIDATGVEEFLELGETSGVFDHMGEESTHYWQVAITAQESDYLYRVDIVVGWADGARPRQVTLTTMMNGKGIFEETEDRSQQQTQG